MESPQKQHPLQCQNECDHELIAYTWAGLELDGAIFAGFKCKEKDIK